MKIKPFLNNNFFLENKVARALYHDYAKHLPIIDYHSHILPSELATNRRFENLTQIWLENDHAKWTVMRTHGINEKYITGDASDFEKFEKWASTLPYAIRNPIFLWNHLELKRFFSIDKILTPTSAKAIYEQTKTSLQSPELSARNIIKTMNVETIATTDDPIDSLNYHRQLNQEIGHFKLIPTFRPDNIINIERPNLARYLSSLSEVANTQITCFDELLTALQNRINFFHNSGCKISDHGLEQCHSDNLDYSVADKALRKRINNIVLSKHELSVYKSTILFELGKMYSKKQWVMQLHLGAIRNNNTRMAKVLGSDSGFDCMGDLSQGVPLLTYLDRLDKENLLPKTIIYNLNPRDNEVFASIANNFNDGSIKGKIQFGSAWWYNDQKHGIEKQLNTLSNIGMLSCFIGMLSDSRSLLSYTRHEYFRRILCNVIGKDVHNGELPNDLKLLGKIVGDICYYNAKSYFNIDNSKLSFDKKS